jgi:MraZ protein
MPENINNNEEIHYHSRYRHGVDDKRRVQVPAKWRPATPEATFTLILWPNGNEPEACLLVLPPKEMKAMAERIHAMPFADQTAQALRRLIGRKSDVAELDKAGRMCLPEEMAKAAGISSEAVLVGLVDRFEIWSPARFEAVSKVDDALLTEAFKLI